MWLVMRNSEPAAGFPTSEEAVAYIRKIGGWNLWDVWHVAPDGAIKLKLADLLKG